MTTTDVHGAPELDQLRCAPVNLRDLGGIEIAGGAMISGFVVRSDDLSIVDSQSAQRLVDRGLSTIIDLRSAEEVALTGRGVLGSMSPNYHHIPFMASINPMSDRTSSTRTVDDTVDWRSLQQSQFGSMYLGMYVGVAHQIVTALGVMAHSPGLVAFHCAAGQDRTGVLAAALLLTLGASDGDIVEDYARTGPQSAAIRERITPILRPLMQQHGFDIDAAAGAALRSEFSAEPMRELLGQLRADYADPLIPLRRAGLSSALISALHLRAFPG